MKIKNLTRRTLILRRAGTRPNIALVPGEGDYAVSLKNDEDAARLVAMKCANLISYGPKEVKNVRDDAQAVERTGADGDTDSVKGELSEQTTYTGGGSGGVPKRRNKENKTVKVRGEGGA